MTASNESVEAMNDEVAALETVLVAMDDIDLPSHVCMHSIMGSA